MRAHFVAVTLVLVATSAAAQKEDVTERYAVAFDIGFPTDYDDTGMWNGGYDAGVAGLRELAAGASLALRFGLAHWSYTSAAVINDLIPPGAHIEFEQSTGQVELLTLTPMIRYQRENVLGRLGAVVEGGVGLAYVKTFALTDVGYTVGPDTAVENFEVNETDLGASVLVGAGFSHAVSSSSWIDLLPSFRATFAGDDTWQFVVSAAFRVRV